MQFYDESNFALAIETWFMYTLPSVGLNSVCCCHWEFVKFYVLFIFSMYVLLIKNMKTITRTMLNVDMYTCN